MGGQTNRLASSCKSQKGVNFTLATNLCRLALGGQTAKTYAICIRIGARPKSTRVIASQRKWVANETQVERTCVDFRVRLARTLRIGIVTQSGKPEKVCFCERQRIPRILSICGHVQSPTFHVSNSIQIRKSYCLTNLH